MKISISLQSFYPHSYTIILNYTKLLEMNINLKIEKAVYEGYGLGFHEGKAVFVPYSVPGDEAEVGIIKDHKDHCFGRIINLIIPSGERVKPECPNFGICGGCDYLNITYDKEISLKKQIVEDSLARIGRMPEERIPEIFVLRAGRFHYRSHADIKCDKGEFGFYEKNSNTLAPFPSEGCILLSRPIIERLSRIDCAGRNQLKIAASHNKECVTSADNPAIVHESENGIKYDRDISCFFQANAFLRQKMLATAGEYAALTPDDAFLDIGCGSGFFTLYLSRFAKSGAGIDIDSTAIKWARRNAKQNNCGNVKFSVQSDSDLLSGSTKYTVIIADPPRPGLSKKSRTAITEIRPERIVYVSCNPATFARDSADFISSGYSLNNLTLIDMFPATYHIEIIGLFAL